MQVPAQVEYERAASVEHALDLLARYGPEARVLAGGHSLIPMMKLRLAQPETLIDINGLTELAYLTVTDAGVEITAQVRTADRTGVEMEALTSVSVAALTLIDMIKAVDKSAVITDVRLEAKDGGRSGAWRRA